MAITDSEGVISPNPDSGSSKMEFHDSQNSHEDRASQTLTKENEKKTNPNNDNLNMAINETGMKVYNGLDLIIQEQSKKRKGRILENLSKLSYSGEEFNSAYCMENNTDIEQPLKVKIKRVAMPSSILKRILDFAHLTTQKKTEELNLSY